MDFETALRVANERVYAKQKRHLGDAEEFVFRGSWNGLSYEEMQVDAQYSFNYLLRDVGPGLWRTLSEAFEEKVSKSNLRAVLQRAFDKEGLEALPVIEPNFSATFLPFWPDVTRKLHQSDIDNARERALHRMEMQVMELIDLKTRDYNQITSFWQSEIVLEELDKPFQSGMKPDANVLVLAFEQAFPVIVQSKVMRDSYEELKRVRLESWFHTFVRTYFEITTAFIRYRAKQQEYLKRLITSCEDVKFVGLDVSARVEHRAAQLLDIFVVPNVSEGSTTSTLKTELMLQERPEQIRSISANEMLNPTRQRVVLLGDSGTGKTTLMRYLAVKVARGEGAEIGVPEGQERVPILVYMRDWAKHPERSFLEQVQDYAQNILQLDLSLACLEHWTDGQALLLLDGLDEVADEATRAALVEKINCFLARPDKDNWAVITSRPWGYRRDYFRAENFPHYELELFNDKQVQEFIEHWYLSRCTNDDEAREMVMNLQNALTNKDRLKTWVKNPLLLIMVVLIHRYQGTLPKRRYKLYDRAVDILLNSWDRKGKGQSYGDFKHLDPDDLRRVMSQLAYWIHTQYETQTPESGILIEEAELLEQLSRIIRQEYPQAKPHQAREEAKRFLSFVRDRAGLLNEYPSGRYAFVHKAFQEYLTAEFILREAEYEYDFEAICTVFNTYLHKAHWQEVLLLLVSQLKGEKAARVIELALYHGSPYEQWLHRDLLFAGRCLIEDPERLAMVAPDLVSEILQKLIHLGMQTEEKIGRSIYKEVIQILSLLKETSFETEALNQLTVFQGQIDQYKFLYLHSLLDDKEFSIETLLALLKNKDLDIRSKVVEVLGNSRNQSEAVIRSLLKILKDTNSNMRSKAAIALGNLDDYSDATIQALLYLLKDKNSNVRSSAVIALGGLGVRSEVVLDNLSQLLKDENSNVRSSAVIALGGLGVRSEVVLDNLSQLLKDENSNVRSIAAAVLEKLDKSTADAESNLVKWIMQHTDHPSSGLAIDVLWQTCS